MIKRRKLQMYYDLLKLKKELDFERYSLKDLALYFEKYDGYVCEITTNERKIKLKITVSAFPHMIGLQHAFKGQKSKNEYKGISGFEKIRNGEITYEQIRTAIKNSASSISWKNIKDRIKFLPVFFNTIEDKNTKMKLRDDSLIARKTYLNGDYFVYKNLSSNIYPMLSLKKIASERIIIETFIVERNITLLGALKEEKMQSIKLISPLKNTTPITINKKETVKL